MLSFRFALGTAPGKWLERYSSYTEWGVDSQVSSDPLGDVLSGDCLLGLVRLPDSRINDDCHIVYLYEEEPGVAVSRESDVAQLGYDRIHSDDLGDELVNYRIADSGEVNVKRVGEALQVVAANVGVCIAPRPLLRALSKKKVVALGLEDPQYPVTQIALVWKKQQDSEMIQDFVGVAKGRTLRSGRYSPRASSGTRDEKVSSSLSRKNAEGTTSSRRSAGRGSHGKRGGQSRSNGRRRLRGR